MKTPQEIADGIVGMIRVAFLELNENMTVEGLAKHNENMNEAVESIAAAIQAERDVRPPKGHVVTDDGVVRKVLGTLPITADGCVIGRRVSVFSVYWSYPGSDVAEVCYDSELWRVHGPRTQSFDASTCYSTREAAEAAKNKEKP